MRNSDQGKGEGEIRELEISRVRLDNGRGPSSDIYNLYEYTVCIIIKKKRRSGFWNDNSCEKITTKCTVD